MPDAVPALEGMLHRAVLAGDEEAWRALYKAHFASLYAYVHWRCAGRREWAEDIVQEVWLTALNRMRSFEPGKATFLAWLRGIAANVIRNYLRKEGRREHRQLSEDETARADSIQEDIELQERLARALAELPSSYEEV